MIDERHKRMGGVEKDGVEGIESTTGCLKWGTVCYILYYVLVPLDCSTNCNKGRQQGPGHYYELYNVESILAFRSNQSFLWSILTRYGKVPRI